jgi:opacity protein-like surface antigen
MRRVLTPILAAAVLAVAVPSAAQPAAWPERIWFGVSGGVQPATNGFNDAFDLPLYTEQEHVTVDYGSGSGALIAASGGYRIWKRLAIGLGVTRYAHDGSSTVNASLPHPFFDNTFREIEGTAPTERTETGAHLLIGWTWPITGKLRVLLTAGPSFIDVRQEIVTNVRFSESFPFDTAEFTGVDTRTVSDRGTGFNAGADVSWMFSKRVGAGALAQFTRARVRLDTGDGRTISVDAGGAQIGAGLRFVF